MRASPRERQGGATRTRCSASSKRGAAPSRGVREGRARGRLVRMRVVRLTKWGIDGLGVDDAPNPKPESGELLLRVRAVSLNYRDLLIVRGEYDPKLALPLV